MPDEFTMPKLGLTMTEGTIQEWLVPDGARVQAGEPVLVIETDKVETEVEARADGVLRVTGVVGSAYACGDVIGYLFDDDVAHADVAGGAPAGESLSDADAEAPIAPKLWSVPPAQSEPVPVPDEVVQEIAAMQTALAEVPASEVPASEDAYPEPAHPAGSVMPAVPEPPVVVAVESEPVTTPASGVLRSVPSDAERIAASPRARSTARELDVELALVAGTGPGGRIVHDDVLAAHADLVAQAERAAAERLAAEQAAAERLEAERLEMERLAAEQAEAERLAAEQAERLAAEQAAAERLEAERLHQERVEAERLEAERLAAEQAETERLEAEQRQADRLAAEQLEASRREAAQLEADRLAAERAEAARVEAERIATLPPPPAHDRPLPAASAIPPPATRLPISLVAPAASAVVPAAVPVAPAAVAPVVAPGASPATEAGPSATSGARMLADFLGVDLRRIPAARGTRITREDVGTWVRTQLAGPESEAEPDTASQSAVTEPAVELPALLQEPTQVIPFRGMRGIIAERMHSSLSEMAQLTLSVDVDVSGVNAERSRRKTRGQTVPGYTAWVVAAASQALGEHPYVNSQITADGIALLPDVHVGVAVALDEGLIVPVIEHANLRSVEETHSVVADLAVRARNRKLGLEELEGATFSVTALGMYGVDVFTPVINPPNTAILGVGRLRSETSWIGGRPAERVVMTLSLTWDHRAFDGAPAAEFAQTIVRLLESPTELV